MSVERKSDLNQIADPVDGVVEGANADKARGVEVFSIPVQELDRLSRDVWRVICAIDSQRALARALRASMNIDDKDEIPDAGQIADMIEAMAEQIEGSFSYTKHFLLDLSRGAAR